MPSRPTLRITFLSVLSCGLSLMPLVGCDSVDPAEESARSTVTDKADEVADEGGAEDDDAENVAGADGDRETGATQQKEKPDALYSPEAFRQAAHDGKLRVVEMCIEGGLDVNQADPNGNTPLAMAAFNGHEAVVKLLLQHGASVDSSDRIGITPLIHAASCPSPSAPGTVKLLLDAGADIRRAGGQESWTALMMAAAEGNLEVVKLLLAEGANKDTTDADGDTAADFAKEKGHAEIIKLLEAE